MTAEGSFQLGGSAAERYELYVAPIMGPFVSALLDGASVERGRAVLDVACGTGFAARAAAERVGPSGRVAGVDINAGMLAVARTASVAAAVPIEWFEAPASALPFEQATFDSVVCQQGLQFVADLDESVAEMARATRRGGVVAATVWSPLDRSPYFAAQGATIDALLGGAAADSFAAAFGCTASALSSAFATAGLTDISSRDIVAEITLPSISGFVPAHLTALPWGATLAEARADGVEEATRGILARLAPWITDDSLQAPFASILVTGRR